MEGAGVPICPECQGDLTFVCSWSARGAWGYDEVRTYECPTHGPIFVTSEISVSAAPGNPPDNPRDDTGRDPLVPARRSPTPILNAGAVALPEPEPDSNWPTAHVTASFGVRDNES